MQIKWKVLTPLFFYHEVFFNSKSYYNFYYCLVLNFCDIVLVYRWTSIQKSTSVNLLGYFFVCFIIMNVFMFLGV